MKTLAFRPKFSKQLGEHLPTPPSVVFRRGTTRERGGGKERERERNPSCVFGTEVFFLRVVLASIVFLQSSTRVEMVYVLLFYPRGRLSCASPLRTTTTTTTGRSIPQTSASSFQGRLKPQESAWQQPHCENPESTKGIKTLKHVRLCDFSSLSMSFSTFLGLGGTYT